MRTLLPLMMPAWHDTQHNWSRRQEVDTPEGV